MDIRRANEEVREAVASAARRAGSPDVVVAEATGLTLEQAGARLRGSEDLDFSDVVNVARLVGIRATDFFPGAA